MRVPGKREAKRLSNPWPTSEWSITRLRVDEEEVNKHWSSVIGRQPTHQLQLTRPREWLSVSRTINRMLLTIPIPEGQQSVHLPPGTLDWSEDAFFRFCQANATCGLSAQRTEKSS
jgi:hypothetical protein